MNEDPVKDAPTPTKKSESPLQVHSGPTASNILAPLILVVVLLTIIIIVIVIFWHIFHPSNVLPPGEY